MPGDRDGAASRRGPFAAFFAFGALWGAWAVLVPVVQDAVGASKGELGLALLCVGLGALPSMTLVGPRIDRAPWILPLAASILAAVALLPAFVSSVPALAAVLLAFGAASGLLDVAINAEVAAIEEATGRRSMQLAHALFSSGLLVGALAAGAARELGADRLPILAGAAAGLLGAAILNRSPLPRAARPASNTVSLGLHALGLRRAAVAIALVCAGAFAVEGAFENWSALFLARDLHAGPAASALGPAAYAVAMAGGRFSGAALTTRLGDRRLLTGGALCAICGTLLAAVAPTAPLAIAGFFLGGAGVSVAAPIALGAAGRIGGAGAIATVTTIGYLAFLAGPPLVGGIAQATSLRVSFGLLALVAAAVAAAATRVRLD